MNVMSYVTVWLQSQQHAGVYVVRGDFHVLR